MSCPRENLLPAQGAAFGIKVTLQGSCCPTAPTALEGRGLHTQGQDLGLRAPLTPLAAGHHSHQLQALLSEVRNTNHSRILFAAFPPSAKSWNSCSTFQISTLTAQEAPGSPQSWGRAGMGPPGKLAAALAQEGWAEQWLLTSSLL